MLWQSVLPERFLAEDVRARTHTHPQTRTHPHTTHTRAHTHTHTHDLTRTRDESLEADLFDINSEVCQNYANCVLL